MLARVQSYVLQGIDALPCEVEIDFDIGASPGAGGPGEEQKQRTTTVGLPDTAVKESIERVRSAMGNSGYPPQNGKVLINLAPADIRKEGPLYDLPIAVGLLLAQRAVGTGRGDMSPVVRSAKAKRGVGAGAGVAASGGREKAKPFDPFAIEEDEPPAPAEPLDYRQFLFAGELALDGRLRPIRGVIAMAALAKAKGFRGVVVPAENAAEAAMVPGVESIGIATLSELVGILNGDLPPQMHPPADIAALLGAATATVDFVEVRGQEAVKRAITVACAGAHNLLRLGPSDRHGSLPHRPVGHNLVQRGPSGRIAPLPSSLGEKGETSRFAQDASQLPAQSCHAPPLYRCIGRTSPGDGCKCTSRSLRSVDFTCGCVYWATRPKYCAASLARADYAAAALERTH